MPVEDAKSVLAQAQADAASVIAQAASDASAAVTKTAADAAASLTTLTSQTSLLVINAATLTAQAVAKTALKDIHKGRWQFVWVVLTIDLIITPGIAVSSYYSNQALHRDEVAACQDANRKAQAQIADKNYDLAKSKAALVVQQQGLADVIAGKYPQFNTPALVAAIVKSDNLAIVQQQKDIVETQTFLSAYTLRICPK